MTHQNGRGSGLNRGANDQMERMAFDVPLCAVGWAVLWARLETKAGDVESGEYVLCSARARALFVFMM